MKGIQRRITWKPRGIGSYSLLLILVWGFIISYSVAFSVNKIFCNMPVSAQGAIFIGVAVFSVSLPITSLLAEVLISRYKLVSYSLKLAWLLTVMDCIISFSCSSIYSPGIIAVLKIISIAGFVIGVLPLGIDQLTTGTDRNISSFLQWLVWVYFAAYTMSDYITCAVKNCSLLNENIASSVLSLLPVLFLSLGLILDSFFHDKLVIEPVTTNPIRLIFRVLKYAAKHKNPVRRSAFTYCENVLPSRLDYGKTKYGGPFTTEEVEDVKTFWRIVVVLFVVSMLMIPTAALLSISYDRHWLNCKHDLLLEATMPYTFIMFMIPLYELLVYPWLKDRGPRILHCTGIIVIALITSSIYGLTTETTLYFTNGSPCLFSQSYKCLFIFIPFNYIQGFVFAGIYKTSFQFICAQAPYNMRGILTGFLGTATALFGVSGILVYGVWLRWIESLDSRYGIWYYLTTLLLDIVISIVLCCVIRRYKARERDDIRNSQTIVEEIYYKYDEQEAQHILSQ